MQVVHKLLAYLFQYDVAKIAALMHRAADLDHVPTIKEVKYLLPKTLLKVCHLAIPESLLFFYNKA